MQTLNKLWEIKMIQKGMC